MESIEKIEDYVANLTKEEFIDSGKDQDAVIRRFEIIEEAAKNIATSTRNKYPDVPWRSMAGMRDVLIHEYFGVDLNEIWNTTSKNLPELKKQLREIIESEST